MRATIAMVVALALFAVLPGCAPSAPLAPTPTAALDSGVDRLLAADGVRFVDYELARGGARAELLVDLDPDVGADALAGIGALVEEIIAESDERGGADAVLRLGDSVFAYFEGMHGDDLRAQLGYWLALVAAGPDSVTMLNFAPGRVPALGVVGGAPTGPSGPQPRYVLVDLPTGIDRPELFALADRLAAVPDPGAPSGQWDLLDLAPAAKGEYTGAAFPDRAELRLDADLGELFAQTPGLAGLQLERDDAVAHALRVQLVVFDPSMDEAAADRAEQLFGATDGFARILDAVAMLEGAHADDYRFSVLSSPLRDGGGFELHFEVTGCEFTGDANWPGLSDRIAERWVASIAGERRAGAECRVDGAPIGGR